MLNLKTLGLTLLCFSLCAIAAAQTNKFPLNEPDMNKPRLFTNLPDQITFEVTELKSLLTTTETGKDITLSSADKKMAPISGKVMSSGNKYNNTIQTLNIRLTSFNNAMLTLSSFTEPDGTVSYTGRIISFTHGDAYELQKKGDQYVLVKKNFNEIVNE